MGPAGRSAVFLICALLLPAFLPERAAAFSFPARDVENSFASEKEWILWPFLAVYRGPAGSETAVHPFWSRQREPDDSTSTHVLWPLLRRNTDPEAWGETDRERLNIFPLWHSSSSTLPDGRREFDRYLIPFYWQGGRVDEQDETRSGYYFILFPFIWHAEQARLVVPLFPPRPQTFSALWPVAGEFRNYWNREQIRFFLWPLLVHSIDEVDDERFDVWSGLWPFFSVYTGAVDGFRVWPLFGRVHRDGAFTRAWWLWPLGQYRSDQAGPDREPREILFFLPFYGKARTPDYEYDYVFPFFGELRQKGRQTRGYALAIYNEEDNLRTGVREHRLFWFLGRWTTRIPVEVPSVSQQEPMEGGGVFPFYLIRKNDERLRQSIAWPFYRRKRSEYADSTFHYTYLFPFYGDIGTRYEDGRENAADFLWPLKRTITESDGTEFTSIPHLFPYTKAEPLDRNWAPLWMVWTKQHNRRSDATRIRLAGSIWRYGRTAEGAERRDLNLGLFRTRKSISADGAESGRTSLLFGALELRNGGEGSRLHLFGKGM